METPPLRGLAGFAGESAQAWDLGILWWFLGVYVSRHKKVGWMRTRRFCRARIHAGPRWLLHTDFHVKVWGDAEKTWPAQLQSECKACQNRRARERKAAREGRDVRAVGVRGGAMSRAERLRRKRERYAEAMKDPEARALRRAQNREAAAVRRRRLGVGVAKGGGYVARREARLAGEDRLYLPVGPLVEWVEPLREGLPGELKKLLERVEATGRISVVMADRVCVSLGRPDVMAVLYGGEEGVIDPWSKAGD